MTNPEHSYRATANIQSVSRGTPLPSDPTPEAAPERPAMTDANIASWKRGAELVLANRNYFDPSHILDARYLIALADECTRQRAVIAERDREIARKDQEINRQLGWLVHLSLSEQPQLNWEALRVRAWYRMHLDMAINGDEVPK